MMTQRYNHTGTTWNSLEKVDFPLGDDRISCYRFKDANAACKVKQEQDTNQFSYISTALVRWLTSKKDLTGPPWLNSTRSNYDCDDVKLDNGHHPYLFQTSNLRIFKCKISRPQIAVV